MRTVCFTHIKEVWCGSILYQCPAGPDKSKKQSIFQPDKETVDLLWNSGTAWCAIVFFMKSAVAVNIAVMGMMVIMMPFFFLAMYERNGQPLEVILDHMVQARFKRPRIRPYKTDNRYAAIMKQADAEMEVEKIVRLSEKEKNRQQSIRNAGRTHKRGTESCKRDYEKGPEE